MCYNSDDFHGRRETMTMWTRQELKERGMHFFQENYWPSVGILFIFSVISTGTATLSSVLLGVGPLAVDMLVVNIIIVGLQKFLCNNRDGKGDISDLFSAYRGNFGNVVLTMFLKDLYTALWSLLLIIPGIIKSYEYRMIPYILADDPELEYKDVFERSKKMMDGEKMNAFLLDLSFIGWFLLSGLTCGILGIFWTEPYYKQTAAELYVVLRDKADGVVETVSFTESVNSENTDDHSDGAYDNKDHFD